MRRRRRQNPLLAKTVGIGFLVALLILPVLAKFGLFKQLHDKYVQTQLINLPPPPPQPKDVKAKAKKPVRPHEEAKRGPRITHATVEVHVAAAASSKGAGDNNNQIVNAAPGGPVGTIPTGPNIPATTPPPVITPPVTAPPVITPPTPPTPPQQPAPKADVLVEAEPTFQPAPVIPDDLLDSDIDMTFYAYFTIRADGTTDVKMVKGTGNSILDRLAMDAAKQWKFSPATKDGTPILSYRRLQVEFVVS